MKKVLFILAVLSFAFTACSKIDVFEKNITFKKHEWPSSVKPGVTFNIDDTTSLYNVGRKTQQYELSLATNKGWNVTGMDDIYEHRVLIQQKTKFNVPGDYQFIFEQVMREDPLENVLNVGLRIERANQ